MAYGLSAAAIGKTSPGSSTRRPPIGTAHRQSSKYIGEQEGGLDKLKGKKIGYIYLDAGYGREPFRSWSSWPAKYGFELSKYPVAANQMQNQSRNG